MQNHTKCIICETQKSIHKHHVRHIEGELVRLCPICYTNMDD